jgi:putative ATPase
LIWLAVPHKFFPKIFTSEAKICLEIDKKACAIIANLSEGDARDAYNALELAIISTEIDNSKLKITSQIAEESIQQKFIRYDKGSDGHYDAISALHKSIRAGDTDASLHYLARMLEAGEDPLYVLRRLVRCASEDIGLADPQALILAVSTLEAIRFIGMPEGNDAVAALVVYLAKAPKSRKVDEAYTRAKDDVVNKRLDPIPLRIRNAPTKMMKDFGFGKDYEMYGKESNLPENLKGNRYWKE